MTTVQSAGHWQDISMSKPPIDIIRSILETSKKLHDITCSLDSEPIGRVLDDLDRIIMRLYDFDVLLNQCEDGFFEIINNYQIGDLELDECLSYLEGFINYEAEDEKVR
ncbi:hypothetical protein BSK54_10380 [Paenibacillus odorifer]|uniref:hypothetical protein n=1 Tax=Paenibacillus odorifer TaxID=189426 RepID=UPI00096D8E99|nr:hypothetical protein [Paenibacillus odorifer]OME02656.1 hypothetical protein BSK54_10380 [Paenibacillus odorifer]